MFAANDTQNIQIEETAVFHSDRPTEVNGPPVLSSLPNTLFASAKDGQKHELESWFRKPMPIIRTTWVNTQLSGSVLFAITIPFDPLQFTMLKYKLQGFLGFKAKTVITMQINGNRFQQGRCFLVFVPGPSPTPFSLDPRGNTINTLYQLTQLPKIDFDISSDSEVTLEIPFVSKYSFYNTINNSGIEGRVFGIVYSPLNSASTELSADVSVWSHFEDIELEYPTVPGPFYVQAGGGKTIRTTNVSNNRNNPSSQELNSEDKPLSSFLGSLSSTLSYGKHIPFLASFTGPASWVSSICKDVALKYGYSNPVGQSSNTPIIQRPMAKGINCTGVDNSVNLGMFEDNSVEVLDGLAGIGVDEMSLQHILSIPTYFGRFTWSDTNTNGTRLFNIPMNPNFFGLGVPIAYNGVSNTVYLTTPLFWTSTLFTYYKGSITITGKLVKTEFHSGRLEIAFSPGEITTLTNDYSCTTYLHREIIDIRDTTEFKITFPYSVTKPYLRYNQQYGNVVIWVQNELRHPDTVLASIDVILECSAAPDFEWAVPSTINYIPWIGGVAPLDAADSDTLINPTANAFTPQCGGFEPQAGGTEVQSEKPTSTIDLTVKPVGTSQIVDDTDYSASRFCIGERLTSLKQLLLRSLPWYLPQTTNTQTRFNPYYCPNASSLGLATPETAIVTDYFTYISACYRFYRGSMRFKVYPKGAFNSLRVYMEHGGSNFVQDYNYTVDGDQLIEAKPVIYSANTTNPAIEFQVPYYNDTYANYTNADYSGHPSGGDYPNNVLHLRSDVGLNNFIIERQGGDDIQMVFWIGTPQLMTLVNNTDVGPQTATW
jgi:hypothetical protein